MVIWRVPEAVLVSTHVFKYRLALVENTVCLVRYDNEAGKGDHKHIGDERWTMCLLGWMRCRLISGPISNGG